MLSSFFIYGICTGKAYLIKFVAASKPKAKINKTVFYFVSFQLTFPKQSRKK